MEKIFVIVKILMILLISCGVSYGQSFRSDYTFDEKTGGWMKFHRMPLRWDQAHLTCFREGAVLASPSSRDISRALSGLMVEHGITTTPIFTGISNKISNSIQKSVEGVPISNTYTQTLENCVGMNADGTKAEVSCFDYHPFACFFKKEARNITECGNMDPEYVSDNRTGSCYKVHRDQHKWSDASAICAAEGGHLAVINSQDEADVIWELAKDSLSDEGVSVIIGFRSDSNQDYGFGQRTWTTVQGESLEETGYTRWYSGEPNSLNENCGSVVFRGSKEDGILNDVSCDMNLMFICEMEPNSTTPTQPPNSTATTSEYKPQAANEQDNKTAKSIARNQGSVCPIVPECDTLDTEYILNNRTGSCYKVHKDTHTWTEAYHVCASEGGHLAVINSQDEAEVVWDLAVKSLAEYSIFIGYRAFGDKRVWVTVQGQTLADAGYDKWNWGEPNNVFENCGGLNGSIDHGILNDVGCDIDLTFICEIEPRASTFMMARN